MTLSQPKTHGDFTVFRAVERGRTRLGWLNSAHSFSFGRYHDPERMGYRALRVINDDVVAPGGGFGEHPHADMEIITWVLSGALRHGDSLENSRQLSPGEVQVMSAGSGVRHSEFNASGTEPAHFLQVWIEPAERGGTPRYDQSTVGRDARHNRFAPIASGRDEDVAAGALPIRQDAAVWVADVDDRAALSYAIEEGRHVYLHVATGEVEIGLGADGVTLSAGDAVAVESPGTINLVGVEPAQVLLFDLA